MTTHMGIVMTLANSIIGVSLLAMPYCFKQCGLLLATFLLVASSITTRLACHLLVKSGVMCRRKNFEFVAYHAFGVPGKLLVELGIIGFLLGTCVAYFVVMGDLAPTIIAKLFQIENNDSLRSTVLLALAIFIVLPLSLLRNIESLAAISMLTMSFYLMLVFKVLTESFPHLAVADWPDKVHYWRPEGVLQCFPIFAMALACQPQVFEILEVLPNPTLERMNSVVRSAVSICTGLYVSVGILGYVAYAREPFGGNILLSFSPSTSSDIFQLGFVISIALSFPIVVFPCRASLNSLLFKKESVYQDVATQSITLYITDTRFKLLTGGIVGTALVTGLLAPNIELVLGFVGSTIGVATCVVFPAAAFINISNKETNERILAKIMVVLGLVAMLLGVFGNLDAAADKKYEAPIKDKVLFNSPLPPIQQIEIPKIMEIDKGLKQSKEKEHAVATNDNTQELRLEPPVPVEPVLLSNNVRPEASVEKKVEVISKPSVQSLPDSNVNVSKLEPAVSLQKDIKVIAKKETIVEGEKLSVLPKKVDSVHADAIAKEELQLKEDDPTILKKEETQQLLKKLEEHKEEQKQLLKEQQNILDEIKSREGKPKSIKQAKPIEAEQFNDNIEKIQGVIDDLKERKFEIERTKGIRIAEEKKRNAEKQVDQSRNDNAAANATVIGESKPIPAIPAIQPSVINSSSVDTRKVSNNVIGTRDILEEKTSPPHEREKREVEMDSSCDRAKTEHIDTVIDIKVPKVISPPLSDPNIPSLMVEKSNVLHEIKDGRNFQLNKEPRRKKKK